MRLGAKVTIKPLGIILSLLDGHHTYKNLVRFNCSGMKGYCGKQGKVKDFLKDSSQNICKVRLESDTEPELRDWVWHVDWLIIEKNILEGDKL